MSKSNNPKDQVWYHALKLHNAIVGLYASIENNLKSKTPQELFTDAFDRSNPEDMKAVVRTAKLREIDFNTPRKDGMTALIASIIYNDKDLVEALLQGGANPTQAIVGEATTPLSMATLVSRDKDNKEILEMISNHVLGKENKALRNPNPPVTETKSKPPVSAFSEGVMNGVVLMSKSLRDAVITRSTDSQESSAWSSPRDPDSARGSKSARRWSQSSSPGSDRSQG